MLRQLSGSAWAMIEYAWYPLLLFATTPWFLRSLGAEQYGHWMLLTAIVALGGGLNTGTGAATVKAISAAIGRAEFAEVCSVVRASTMIALLGGGALAAIVILVFNFAGPVLLNRMGSPAQLQLTAVAAAVLLWLEQLDTVYSSALKGAERFGQAARVEVLSKTAQIGAAAMMMLVHRRLWLLYAVLIAGGVLRLLAKAALVRRHLAVRSLRPRLEGTGNLLRFAKWGWLQGIGGVLFGVADRLLIGSMLGAACLTYYSIASQLAMQIHAASGAAISVVFPKVSRKLEAAVPFSLWRVTGLTMIGSLFLSSLIAIGLLVFGAPLLHFWLGDPTAAPTALVLPWLVLAYWVLALALVPYYVLLGMGRMRDVSKTVLVSGMVGIAAAYVGIIAFGLPGAAAGRGAYALGCLGLLLPLARHFWLPRDRNAAMHMTARELPLP